MKVVYYPRKFCLRCGHDWKKVGPVFYGDLQQWECTVCGEQKTTFAWDKKRAGLLAYPVTVKPRIRRLE